MDVFDQVAQEAAQQAVPQGTQRAAQQAAGPQGQTRDVFDQVAQEDAPQSPQTPAGEQVNDIGKTVIVLKEGESFSDTMKRAAAQGKKTTQQDINDELATAPKKVAQVVAAAPVIGGRWQRARRALATYPDLA